MTETPGRPGDRSDRRPPRSADYMEMLDSFGAEARTAGECRRLLEEKGFTSGQARNAVYRYRRARGLTRKK